MQVTQPLDPEDIIPHSLKCGLYFLSRSTEWKGERSYSGETLKIVSVMSVMNVRINSDKKCWQYAPLIRHKENVQLTFEQCKG